ncbi:MAG: T9SS type A sorting domain-containing protein [Candidatus Eisenbacteria bacterium]|nr:T9SS type A sorting domain-containing protein [Candidatus Eisenbacteria bacterium]
MKRWHALIALAALVAVALLQLPALAQTAIDGGASRVAGIAEHAVPQADLTAPEIGPITSRDLEHVSLIFTVSDVVFFSYTDDTYVELRQTDGTLIWNNGGLPLDKGDHGVVTVSEGVYVASGSEKFAVLTGDPVSLAVVGYYAMDQEGFGTSLEFYTWVPDLYGHCKFVVFAYDDATNVTVEYTDTAVPIAAFMLNAGEHWDIETLDSEWIHVMADKPVSALTCYDQGYFVPSADGHWSGTLFYTYVSDIEGWTQDLSVFAYDDNTSVLIEDSVTGIPVWSGILGSGQAHVETYAGGADQFFTITSDHPVTVASQPWLGMTSNYHQGLYVQDREGAGIGTDLIGSTLNAGSIGSYLYVMSYTDGCVVDVYDSQTDVFVNSYTLNRGEYVDANPGNGLWRLRSTGYISAYSGAGYANADFAPVEFGEVFEPIGYYLDIKPTSCPNPLNIKSNGVLPVALLGGEDADVMEIDPESLLLAGVAPLRWSYEDVATPIPEDAEECECTTAGPDGYLDMTVKFNKQAVVEALEAMAPFVDGEVRMVYITGETFEGDTFEAYDCVRILDKRKLETETLETEFQGPGKGAAVTEFGLGGGSPNPFRSETSIFFSLPAESDVSLTIYNVAGKKIRTVVDGQTPAGYHAVSWDGRDETGAEVATGVYFCRMNAGDFRASMKLVRIE